MADNIVRSYQDVNTKADVVGLIEILTASETWFLNNLGKTTAIQTVHSTMTDTLRTTATAAVSEADDFTAGARTLPSLVTNLVEKIAIPFKVSRTQQLVQKYFGENELARQTTKALQEWGNAAEYDLVLSSLTSGTSGTTPKMAGIVYGTSVATNHTSQSSGTAFAASILNGLMRANVENSNGDAATDVFMGSFLKYVMDTFTTKSNTLAQVPASEIAQAVDVISTSFGRLNSHYERNITAGAVLGIKPDTLRIAYLRRPYLDTGLQRAGDYDFRAVVGDLTLEVRNKTTNFYADGFDYD